MFNKRNFNFLITLPMALLVALLASQLTAAKEPQSAVLTQIMRWWPGDYNNQSQLELLEKQGKPIWREDDTGKGGHIEVASYYRLYDLPSIGEHVLYVEELKHGKPDLIFRQRFYTLTETDGVVRVKLWYFKDKEKYIGAWKNLDMLNDINKEALFPLGDNCDLIVSKQGDKFHMAMQDGACVFGENVFNYQVLLGENSFWFRDRIDNAKTGAEVSSAGEFTYHELERVN